MNSLYHETTREPLNGFSCNIILGSFNKMCQYDSNFGKSLEKITDICHEDLNAHLERNSLNVVGSKNVLKKRCSERRNMHFLSGNFSRSLHGF